MGTLIGWLVVGAAGCFGLNLLDKFTERRKRRREEEEAAAKAERERIAVVSRKKEAEKKQKSETKRYIQSDLLQEILNALCDGDTAHNFPAEITIYDRYIQAVLHGRTIVYDFVENRIPLLEPVYEILDRSENWDDIYRPMIAVADAINYLLGEQYGITDFSQKLKPCYRDGFFVGNDSVYESDHVLMRLKPQRNF